MGYDVMVSVFDRVCEDMLGFVCEGLCEDEEKTFFFICRSLLLGQMGAKPPAREFRLPFVGGIPTDPFERVRRPGGRHRCKT